jgi:NDP-sugar pyrophosphorylase family protein
MQVVILAGGIGTRMSQASPGIPKALIPVNGRPFIEHQFDLLAGQGMTDVLLCIGHLGDMIESHVGDGSSWGVSVAYCHEDPMQLLGTGGALLNAMDQLDETFFTLYGDSYLTVDYEAVVESFFGSSDAALMCVCRNEGKWDTSNARVDDGRVVLYSKTASPDEVDCIDYGLTGFHRDQIEAYLGTEMPLDLARIQGDLVEQGRMRAFEVKERFFEIGKPEGLRELEAHLNARK